MTKKEAVEVFAEKRFNPIPTEWVRVIAEKYNEYPNLPMWGTMWQIDEYRGERLIKKAHYVDAYNNDEDSEEMNGAYNVLDKDGKATAVYIYEIDSRYLIGVHGAGWNFYTGVWDMLYDLYGINWHDDEEEIATPYPTALTNA